eukprot:428911-Pelagomonas_calceolata.AAC.1
MDKAKGFVLYFHVWLRAVTAVLGCCAFKDKELKGAGHTSAHLRVVRVPSAIDFLDGRGMIVVVTDEGVGGVLCSLP